MDARNSAPGLTARWASPKHDDLWCGEVLMTGPVATAFKGELDTEALLAAA